MVDDVARLMDHLGLRTAHMLGYSMGGQVIGNLLARHSERFQTANVGGSAPLRTFAADSQRGVEAAAQDFERGVMTMIITYDAFFTQPLLTVVASKAGSKWMSDDLMKRAGTKD